VKSKQLHETEKAAAELAKRSAGQIKAVVEKHKDCCKAAFVVDSPDAGAVTYTRNKKCNFAEELGDAVHAQYEEEMDVTELEVPYWEKD
jgi:hypothetical protein